MISRASGLWPRHARLGEQTGQPAFGCGLCFSGYRPGGMTGQLRELDNQPCESRSGPARRRRGPVRQLVEEGINHSAEIVRHLIADAPKPLHPQFAMMG
jgi:hypothetical protein